MKPKFALLLALFPAVTFVSAGISYAAETGHDKVQPAVEQATQEPITQKVEVEGKLEEEKGKTTLELKKIRSGGEASKEAATSEIPK